MIYILYVKAQQVIYLLQQIRSTFCEKDKNEIQMFAPGTNSCGWFEQLLLKLCRHENSCRHHTYLVSTLTYETQFPVSVFFLDSGFVRMDIEICTLISP